MIAFDAASVDHAHCVFDAIIYGGHNLCHNLCSLYGQKDPDDDDEDENDIVAFHLKYAAIQTRISIYICRGWVYERAEAN